MNQKLQSEGAAQRKDENDLADLVAEKFELTDIKINDTQKQQQQQQQPQEAEERKGDQPNEAQEAEEYKGDRSNAA